MRRPGRRDLSQSAVCIYWGALFGGAITSILFNIPGEPWSVATTFDGYPMAQQGRAGQALTAAFTSSFVGAFFAVVMITFLSPVVAGFALAFGPPEFFAVYLLTFCAFVGTSKEPPFKTLASMMLGFALATVGTDTVTGTLRLTFGSTHLLTGFDFLVAVIGLFGIGEILLTLEEGLAFRGAQAKINARVVLDTWKELPRYWLTSLRSTLVGCFMGIVPGGATPASFMSYGVARRFRPTATSSAPARSRRGGARNRGARRGHFGAAAEDHARRARSPTAAVLLGGLMIWGLQPGPLLFHRAEGLVLGLIASILGNIAGVIVVLTCVPLFAAILARAVLVIAPIIVICAIGSFTVKNAIFDVWMMVCSGSSATCSRSCSIRSRPWCSPSCWETTQNRRSASRCSCRRARSASSSPSRWSAR